ncbi:MAG: serine hydrolase domain-containing protein [Saprospiraceae bacterium]
MKIIILGLALMLVTTCQSQTINNPLLQDLKAKVAEKVYPKIDGIIVEHGDKIIVEEYFNDFEKDSLHDTRSSFKSITSLLAGIAIDKQLFTLEDKLSRFFPDLKNEEKRNIRVKDLLEMRSGLNCEEFYEIGPECESEMWDSKDWIAYCLNVEVKGLPGLNWSYSSNDPMLVGEIISRASGMSIMEFAKQNLFKPLGIEKYRWTISPKGRGMTAGSFYMRPIDMLKVIDLVENKGRWNDQQIVSEEWVEQSTNCEIDIDFSFTRYSKLKNAKYRSAAYGFFWYQEVLQYKNIKTSVLFASGNGGQYMMLLPDYNAKVIFTGSNYGNWRGKLPFEILLRYLIPMIEKKN